MKVALPTLCLPERALTAALGVGVGVSFCGASLGGIGLPSCIAI